MAKNVTLPIASRADPVRTAQEKCPALRGIFLSLNKSENKCLPKGQTRVNQKNL